MTPFSTEGDPNDLVSLRFIIHKKSEFTMEILSEQRQLDKAVSVHH